jgi:hypothetical protein
MFSTEEPIDESKRTSLLTDFKPKSEPERRIAQELIDINFRLSRPAAVGNNMFRCGLVQEPPCTGRTTPKKIRRRYPITGQVKDVDGDSWDIRDVRTTKHGFDLYFGTPENNHGAYRGGPARLIATQALCDFWEANQIKGHGFLFDLPAGATTLKRLRRRLGFNFRTDTREFYSDRREDLDSLPPREFATKHGVGPLVAFDWRRRIVGIRARPIGWWRKAKFRRILLANLTLIETGRKLGVGTTHAKRLRDRARLESQLRGTPVDQKVILV